MTFTLKNQHADPDECYVKMQDFAKKLINNNENAKRFEILSSSVQKFVKSENNLDFVEKSNYR